MTFSESVKSCFGKYLTFSGRAPRSEFWYFVLFCVIAGLPMVFLGDVALAILVLILFPAAVSVEVRRLHDTDRSGWWFWLNVVPIINLIKIVWFCSRGTEGVNRFGADPLTVNTVAAPKQNTRSVPMGSKTEQLGQIKSLLDAGTITQVEFEKMKAQILES